LQAFAGRAAAGSDLAVLVALRQLLWTPEMVQLVTAFEQQHLGACPAAGQAAAFAAADAQCLLAVEKRSCLQQRQAGFAAWSYLWSGLGKPEQSCLVLLEQLLHGMTGHQPLSWLSCWREWSQKAACCFQPVDRHLNHLSHLPGHPCQHLSLCQPGSCRQAHSCRQTQMLHTLQQTQHIAEAKTCVHQLRHCLSSGLLASSAQYFKSDKGNCH